MRYLGVSDSQKKVPPLPPSIASRSDSGSGRPFNDGATFLTFNPSPFDGKIPIVDYVITATSETNEVVTATVANLASFVLTGLKSGIRYRYQIKARNGVFDSENSSQVGPDLATTVPGRPTSLTAINLGNGGGISLNWVAPPNGGQAITSYTITPSVGAPIVTNNASTSYSFTGVVGTTYNFTVFATNVNGSGENSTASGTVVPTNPVTTTAAPTPAPTTAAPGGSTGGGGSIGINSFSMSAGRDDGGTLNLIGSWSAFGYASWSFSAGGCSTGIINSTASSGAVACSALGSSLCNQTVSGTLTVYSGANGTGGFASRNASFTNTCATQAPTFTYNASVCCIIGGTYNTFTASSSSCNNALGIARSLCITSGGTTNGSEACTYSTSFPSISCSAPTGGGTSTTTAAPTTTTTTSAPINPCSGLGGFIESTVGNTTCTYAYDLCGNAIPGTENCVTSGTTPTTTSAPTTTTTTAAPCLPARDCYCYGSFFSTTDCNGNCRCGTVSTTSAPVTQAPTTRAPATPAPTTSSPGCICRDFRGRCAPISFCLA